MRSALTLFLFAMLVGCGQCPQKSAAEGGGRRPATGPEPAEDDRGEILAIRHGVTCDGKTDDTDALQQVIDSARVTGGIGRRVILPTGTCIIKKTLVMRSVAGASLRGQGVFVTDLEWHGDDQSPLLLLDHTYRVTIADFSITPGGKNPLAAGIRIENGAGCTADQDPTCGKWPSTSDTLSDLVMRGQGRLAIGVHVHLADPQADRKNDHHRFERVQVTAYTNAGFVIEGRNAKGLTFNGCICQGRDKGKACVDTTPVPRHGGSFWWYGGMAAGNTVADFDIGDRNDTLLLSGVYSEKSARFLRVQDKSHAKAMPFPVVVEAVRFATTDRTAADGEVIQFLSSGPLTVSGSRWGVDGPDARPVRFRFDPPGAAAGAAAKTAQDKDSGFVFSGNYVTGPETAPFTARSPSQFSGNVLKAGAKDSGTLQDDTDVPQKDDSDP